MGDRWGLDGPPPEAYSRVTNPERFRPLHGFAQRLLRSLETEFDVSREEGQGLDPELQVDDTAIPTVRLVPHSADAGPLTVAFTSFPGLMVRLGHWFVEPVPVCGCDACDETAEEGQRRVEGLIAALTAGRVSESIKAWPWADGWLTTEMPSSRGERRISRLEAEALIARAGGKRRFEYGPWPRALTA
jgi:hypothetical protein